MADLAMNRHPLEMRAVLVVTHMFLHTYVRKRPFSDRLKLYYRFKVIRQMLRQGHLMRVQRELQETFHVQQELQGTFHVITSVS